MCDLRDDQKLPLRIAGQRRKIWELTGGWHCSIIGTCLTLSDLRSLANKLPLKTKPEFPQDYQYHGFFSKEACSANKASKMLTKLLDRRHATSIRKARAMKTAAELTSFWAQSMADGDIPGPYWAIMSHPQTTLTLSECMFADVHMLSHLVGASNRADIRKITAMQEENSTLRETMSKRQRRHIERLDVKDREIAALQAEVTGLRAKVAGLDRRPPTEIDLACKTIPALQGELTRLSAKTSKDADLIREQRARIENFATLIHTLREENKSLEQALVRDQLPEDSSSPFDLEGRSLLYVGGRPHAVHRLRSLVESWNGEFFHHDGGLEKSLNELAGAVVSADAVIFPTDCVSHEAVNTVKRLCRQSMKPYTPVRSSGIASFVAGLKENFGPAHMSGDAD